MLTSPIDVLWTARYDYQPGWRLELHQHTYFQMIYFLGGRGTLRLGEANHPIRAGILFLIKPSEIHGLTAQSMIKTLDIKFRVGPGGLRRELQAAAGYVSLPNSAAPSLFERIRFEGERKNIYYQELCRSLMSELLLLYLRHQKGLPADSLAAVDGEREIQAPLVRKALEFIRTHYGSHITIRDVAHALGCSERAVRLHFQDSLGSRPLLFLQRYRVARAKELIEYSDYALKEIAEAVGFKTVHHFTRTFTAMEGLSPGAWRRKYLEGIRKDVCINPNFSNPSWTVAGEPLDR